MTCFILTLFFAFKTYLLKPSLSLPSRHTFCFFFFMAEKVLFCLFMRFVSEHFVSQHQQWKTKVFSAPAEFKQFVTFRHLQCKKSYFVWPHVRKERHGYRAAQEGPKCFLLNSGAFLRKRKKGVGAHFCRSTRESCVSFRRPPSCRPSSGVSKKLTGFHTVGEDLQVLQIGFPQTYPFFFVSALHPMPVC